MDIKVFNDGEEVFDGPLEQFLLDNDNDEYLVSECAKLNSTDQIELNEFSGHWLIVKQ